MFRSNEPKPLNWKGLPVSPSSFCICLIRDREFSPEPMIFMVYNRADAARSVGDNPKKGKPEGFGMAGGGVNVDDMDTIYGAAERELEYESGLRGTVKSVPLIEENWLLVLNKRNEGLVRKVRYEKGQQPSVAIRTSEKVLLNPVHIFRADVQWQGSRLREFMLQCRDGYISDGILTRDDIARYGLYANDLGDDELTGLGVREKEEIAGFALLPVGMMLEMSRQGQYHLDPPSNTVYVYRSHVDRILAGLEIMKVIGKGADK